MSRHGRKGNIHKVREFDEFTDVVEINSLTAKMLYKYIDILNAQARRRLLPNIKLKVIDEQIKPHGIYKDVYRKDYTISILSPAVNIGEYRPLKLIHMIKQFQKYNNFQFYEATQPVTKDGTVIKELFPYFQTNNAKKTKKVNTVDLLKVSKLIIDTYGYCRQKDNEVEGFNWLRTTGQKAFDILTIEPHTEFKDICMRKVDQFDSEINSMLIWAKICYSNEYRYKGLINKEECDFSDVNKIVSLIPLYRNLKHNEKVSYFVHS